MRRSKKLADELAAEAVHGVGDFDLLERGYKQASTETVLRASNVGAIGKTMYNELRAQWRSDEMTFSPTSTAPAVLVLNAFDAGGAQLDAGRSRTSELRNATGTFTFASLDAYAASLPTTYTRNIGNPDVSIGQAQLGLYVQ